MTSIINVDRISKRYTLGAREEGYTTFREALMDFALRPFRRHRHPVAAVVWALKDVSFAVRPGEVVGIIGRNGAGKSTLLKILSRITKPTSGAVDLYGRVGSLLEVGTGFHPELTGRENIFLNGAVLGMKRAEIQRKFEEIVGFAEVERFLDTPVKRYSSGMYVRLAFAVAAHLEPEILIVDEVLAVGDAAFQKKCLGKLGSVARQGRTVLFVSHNMVAVKALCSRGLLVQDGRVVLDAAVDTVVDAYLSAGSDAIAETGIIPVDAPRTDSTDEARLRKVRLTDLSDNPVSRLYLGEACQVELTVEVFKKINEAVVEVGVVAMDGTHVTHSSSIDGGAEPLSLAPGRYQITLQLHAVLLPRQYSVLVGLHHFNGTTIDWVERALDFTVERVAKAGPDSYRWRSVRGYVRPMGHWTVSNSHPAPELQDSAFPDEPQTPVSDATVEPTLGTRNSASGER